MTELIRPEPWTEQATCANFPGDAWFSETNNQYGGNLTVQAKKVCANCPVRVECLDYALRTQQDHGVWGGLTTPERMRLGRAAS